MGNNQAAHGSVSEAKKKSVIEQLWLNYYNEALYTRGVITEDERNRMKLKIISRAGKNSMER